MVTKTVKISEENYRAICEYAGTLQKELGKPVSVDKALSYLVKKKTLSELSGSWEMSDNTASEIMGSLKKGWTKWQIKSV